MNSWSLAGLDGAVGGFSKEEVIVRSKEYAVYWDCFCCLVCVCMCVYKLKKKNQKYSNSGQKSDHPCSLQRKIRPVVTVLNICTSAYTTEMV